MWTFFQSTRKGASAEAGPDRDIAPVCRAYGCVRALAHAEGFGDRRDRFARASAHYLSAQASGCPCGASRRNLVL